MFFLLYCNFSIISWSLQEKTFTSVDLNKYILFQVFDYLSRKILYIDVDNQDSAYPCHKITKTDLLNWFYF